MGTGSIILLIVVAVLVLLVLYGIAVYNGLVSGRNQVEAAWGQIDVQLKRRHDLIPNLVEVAKDYMDYEQETLQQVIQARNGAVAAGGQSREAAIGAEGVLGAALGRLFALVENYPDLKANGPTRTSSASWKSSPRRKTASPSRASTTTTR
jgi:LemA protein